LAELFGESGLAQHYGMSDILPLDAGSSLGAWLRDGGRFSIADNVNMIANE
jgi:hypothetical protein